MEQKRRGSVETRNAARAKLRGLLTAAMACDGCDAGCSGCDGGDGARRLLAITGSVGAAQPVRAPR